MEKPTGIYSSHCAVPYAALGENQECLSNWQTTGATSSALVHWLRFSSTSSSSSSSSCWPWTRFHLMAGTTTVVSQLLLGPWHAPLSRRASVADNVGIDLAEVIPVICVEYADICSSYCTPGSSICSRIFSCFQACGEWLLCLLREDFRNTGKRDKVVQPIK